MTYHPTTFEEVTPIGADQMEQRYPYSLGAISNCEECLRAQPLRILDEDIDFLVLNHVSHRLRDRRRGEIETMMRRHGERVT